MYTISRSSLFYRWIDLAIGYDVDVDNTCDLPKVVFEAVVWTVVVGVVLSILTYFFLCFVATVGVVSVAYVVEGITVTPELCFSTVTMSIGFVISAAVLTGSVITALGFIFKKLVGLLIVDKNGKTKTQVFVGKLHRSEIEIDGIGVYDFVRMPRREQEYIMAEHGMYGKVRTWWIFLKNKTCHKITYVD